jgi:hypothetical protein
MTYYTDLINNQPFLLSMEQAASQTGDYTDYEALLRKQQGAFLKYVEEWFDFGIAAPKRFRFLKTVECKLDTIQATYTDIIREHDANFHRFWSLLIDNTRKFVSIGVETLKFQSKCPSHILTETEHLHKFPSCNWTANRSDLMELIAGIYQADVIKLQDGSKPSFALFAKEIGAVFGLTFSNPHEETRKILNRKKNQTPFLNRIIACLKDKGENLD